MAENGSADGTRKADLPVLLWLTNKGAAEITANSIASVGYAGFADKYRLIVFHSDDQARNRIERHSFGVEFIDLDEIPHDRDGFSQPPKEYHDFGTQPFRRLSISRYIAIKFALLTFRHRTIYADGDIVFLGDPAYYLDSEPALKRDCVLAQNDRNVRFSGDEFRCQYEPGCFPQKSEICSGFTVWMPLSKHHRIVDSIIMRLLRYSTTPSDQMIFNSLPRHLRRHVQLLPEDKFVNGSFYFGLPENNRSLRGELDPVIVHANWMVGVETKTNAFKKAGLWYL